MASATIRSFTLQKDVSALLNQEVPRGLRSSYVNDLLREHLQDPSD